MDQLKKKPAGRSLLYVALLLLAVWAMFGLRHCSSDIPRRQADRVSGGDTIDVAIEYSPLSMYRYDDTLGGFNYDLLRLIADSADLKIKFHPVASFSSALDRLADGTFDLVVADIPVTTEADSSYLFTEPAFLGRLVLIQLRDSAGAVKVNGTLDLAGKTVYVGRGSSASMRMSNLADEIGDTINIADSAVFTSEQLVFLVAQRKIHYAVVNETLAKQMADKFPEVDFSTVISFNQFQSWLLRRTDTQLKERIDSTLKHIKSLPVYTGLCRRYL